MIKNLAWGECKMKYEIVGQNLPAVVCTLSAGESMITERGSMSWMSQNMQMETTSNGGVGKALGRMFVGEALFQNKYTAVGGNGLIAFASSFPGEIRAFEITPDKPIIAQKTAFLAGEEGIQLSVSFQKKIGAGFFGGEGFIMQKLSGRGTAFVEIDGAAVEYILGSNESMIVDTGYLAAMDASCSMDIVAVKGAKNMLFGGEGVFNTVVKGPGKIIVQTMPIYSTARAIGQYITSK